MFAKDWCLKTDDELSDIARAAFMLGLADGRTLSGPINSFKVLAFLETLPIKANGDKLKMHRIKIRQVYGAGFDIAQCVERVNAP